VDTHALLNGMLPEQYAAMLTAENAKEVSELIIVGQNSSLLDAKAVMSAAVETLLQAENKLHSSVTATAAAAAIHVS
jgi:cobalamin biosynthesis protein CobD/CbiB